MDPQRVLEIAHGVRTIEIVRRLAPHLDAEAEVKRIEKREADDQEGVAVRTNAKPKARPTTERSRLLTTG